MALRFVTSQDGNIRYVDAEGRWYVWDGHCWRKDKGLVVRTRVRTFLREHAAKQNDTSRVNSLRSARTLAAVESVARADDNTRGYAEDWDSNPWLLNTPAGVVDLRTGELLDHRRDYLMTLSTSVGPGGECPTFLAFLDRITAGDRQLQAFLQRMTGYSLTGSIREHALFFGYGSGANGKSVLFNAFVAIMDGYARQAPIETFTASNSDRHPTDIAMMRGARVVMAAETDRGKRWDEAKIKRLTGGDKISARFMRGDFFEYEPKFKLLVSGNYRPSLRSVDEAIRRRLYLIPFDVTIPAAERDPNLTEKLKAEHGGILAWMIDGCLEWQSIGLAPPTAVTKATAEYFAAEDSKAAWMADCCDIGANYETPSSALFRSWKAWAEQANEEAGSQNLFTADMVRRNFEKRETNRANVFRGIRVRLGGGASPGGCR